MRLKIKKHKVEDVAEERFNLIINLIKDLPKADYNRLKDAMDLSYSAYQKIRNVKTNDEKEVEDITNAEKILIKEENK